MHLEFSFKTISALTKTISALTLLAGAMSAQADMQLDGAASSLFYVTSKAASVSEVNSFNGLSGSITEAGTATLVIDLATVETSVEIRNQRMQELVFQVAQFPSANVTVQVAPEVLNDLPVGGSMTGPFMATVDLHGISQELSADLQILKLDEGTLQVQTARPLIVGAGAFGLAEAVEQLREIAGLPSINPNVVVTFTLVYKQ